MWVLWTLLIIGLGWVVFYRLVLANGGKVPTLPKLGLSSPPANLKSIIQIGLKVGALVAFWVFIIWFFPDTVPGKELLKVTGFSNQNKWYPWVMWYIPTALILWAGWWMIFTNPSTTAVAGKTTSGATKSTTSASGIIASIAGWALIIGAFYWGLSTWRNSTPVGKLDPQFMFHQVPDTKFEHVDIEGRMELWYQVPVNQNRHRCIRIAGPVILLEHSKRPKSVDFVQKGAPGGWWYITFSDDFKKFYHDHKLREPIRVEIEVSDTPIAC